LNWEKPRAHGTCPAYRSQAAYAGENGAVATNLVYVENSMANRQKTSKCFVRRTMSAPLDEVNEGQ
jgi:hypothetical protein